MSREIKFRGQRADTKKFVYGYYVKSSAFELGINDVPLSQARVCHVIVVDGEFFRVDPYTVGEFTGLTDKNGVEIYEGDIYKFMHREWNTAGMGDELRTAVVKFKDGGFNGKTNDKYGVEVIGNIYENPDLMEK